jgi:hypothetical protein
MKKCIIAVVLSALSATSMASGNDDLAKLNPVAIKKVSFEIVGSDIFMNADIVFMNEIMTKDKDGTTVEKTILLKNATFNLDMIVTTNTKKKDSVSVRAGLETTRNSDNGNFVYFIPLGEGEVATDRRHPMVLPPGSSIHSIRTNFSEGKTPEEALLKMTALVNAFGNPDYTITMMMSAVADLGQYKYPNDPSSGKIFSTSFEFEDIRMEASRSGNVSPGDGKYELHKPFKNIGSCLFQVGSAAN